MDQSIDRTFPAGTLVVRGDQATLFGPIGLPQPEPSPRLASQPARSPMAAGDSRTTQANDTRVNRPSLRWGTVGSGS